MLELLADPSVTSLTLADVVRRTGQSRATAHAIVSELVDQRWAVRDRTTGTLGVGPAFAALAARMTTADAIVDRARPVMADLSQTLGMPCFVARRVDAETITVAAQTWHQPGRRSADAELPWLTGGRPIRLRPPISREFFAWATADERDRWISRAPAALRTRLQCALSAVADRGYSIERMSDDYVALADAVNSLGTVSDSLRARMGDMLAELTTIDYLPDELHGDVPVITVGAPIFDDGVVVASLVACPRTTLPAVDVDAIGRAVRRAADDISATSAPPRPLSRSDT